MSMILVCLSVWLIQVSAYLREAVSMGRLSEIGAYYDSDLVAVTVSDAPLCQIIRRH